MNHASKKKSVPLAQSSRAWRQTAAGLKRTADIVWERWFGIFKRLDGGQTAMATVQEGRDLMLLLPSVLLLYGLALENAVKGLLIAKDTSIVESRIKWKMKAGAHDLRELFKKADLLITSEEEDLLDALSDAVLWGGRYPVPKNHANRLDFPILLGLKSRTVDVMSIVSSFSDLKNSWERIYCHVLSKYPGQKK
jgi:hypothetical protein